MTDNRAILLLISANNCGVCTELKTKRLGDVRKVIQEYPINFIEVNLERTSDMLPIVYPLRLREYARWFPMLMYITRAEWDKAINDKPRLNADGRPVPSYDPNPQIFAAEIRDGKPDFIRGSPPIDAVSVRDWLNRVRANSVLPKASTDNGTKKTPGVNDACLFNILPYR